MNDNIINDLTKKYGTPLFIYDLEIIKQKYNELKKSLPENSEIFFSMKSNPLIGVIEFIHNLGAKIEVASIGELYTAVEAGYNYDEILFTSPGKTDEEIEYAIDKSLFLINTESLAEIKKINDLSLKKNKITNIMIRINPDFKNNSSLVKMTGISSQFGIEEETLNENFFEEIKNMKNIYLKGFQIYMGTQILNSELIVDNTKEIVNLVEKIKSKYSLSIYYIDCGGGFGVKYFNSDVEFDISLLNLKEFNNYPIKLLFESGRYLLAESGIFCTQILYIKDSKGKRYYICDGGMNNFSSACFLGRFVRNNFPIRVLSSSNESENVNITGPLCTPTDLLGQNIIVNKARVGDLVIIDNAGAYGLTYSPTLFLSHQTPREVAWYNNKSYLLREKSSFDDLIRNQRHIKDEL